MKITKLFPAMRLLAGGLILTCIVLSLGRSDAAAQTNQTVPPFTGAENHSISLADAANLTLAYQSTAAPNAILAEYFGGKAVTGVLTQPGAVGLRIYHGRQSDGKEVLIIVGVDSAGNDLTNGPLLEFGFGCPPICGINSPLMRH